MDDPTLESLFAAAVVKNVPPGVGEAVQRAAAGYIQRAVVFNGRGRALQLYSVANRAWASWVPEALVEVGLPDLARAVRRHSIVDADSVLLAISLAPEYAEQVADLADPTLPDAERRREAVLDVMRETQAMLTDLGDTPPYLGDVDAAQFTAAVRHAAAALVALWRTARVGLATEVAHVLSDASSVAGPVKLPV
jgi:hypothetical protein